MTTALDTQIGGSHYKDMAIQPMEFSMANKLDACQHTIIKYVTRFRTKGGIQDLEKAKHVIDMLIEFEKDEPVPELGDPDFMMGGADISEEDCPCIICAAEREVQRVAGIPAPEPQGTDPIREMYDRLVKANAEDTQERAFQRELDRMIARVTQSLADAEPSGADVTAAINTLLAAGVIRQVEDGDS